MDRSVGRRQAITDRSVMSFKDDSWINRKQRLGDEAEQIFENVCANNYIRYGLERPPLQVWRIPVRIRHTPDYLMTDKFVEVIGCGRDQKLKIAIEKHGALRWWHDLHPTWLFIYDAHWRRYAWISLPQLDELLGGTWGTTLETFPEGKPYFSIPVEAIFSTSDQVGELRDPTP